ncbi:MAG: hypothetical protein JNL10_19950 [Verrucomicrobiales bacterium]|nr:hypothetical protein [Verrucomicrobiales bacterium]
MARTEQGGSVELRWRRLGFAMFLVVGIAFLTVGYSLQRRAHDVLGMQIKKMEKQAEWAKGNVRSASETLARLKRPSSILRTAAEMRLDLAPIAPVQRRVIYLLPPLNAAGSDSGENGAYPPAGRTNLMPLRALTGSAAFPVRANP